jgi:flagellar basal-body rod modification protein FlgD
MAIEGVSGTTTTSGTDSGRRTIADNFDTFLEILTTQLKHQNPLDPMDTNQFTQQLVQFTSVEQQLKTNEFLEALLLANQSAVSTDAVTYIGKEITAAGSKSELTNGEAAWGYDAEANVANAIVTIKDYLGNVVYSEKGSLPQGPGQFVWDGKGSDGNMRPDGTYTISIAGTNLNGDPVNITTATTGIVTAVDLSGDIPILSVGSTKVQLTDVTGVRIPDDAAPEA